MILFFLLFCFSCEGAIDVVIPCHAKDIPILDLCIEGIKANGEGVRNVYVISKERYTDRAAWVDEALFPFTLLDVTSLIVHNNWLAEKLLKLDANKAGWVYQQLLKLYAPLVLPDLSPNILIVDADTVFLNPVTFLSPEGIPQYEAGGDIHVNYIRFMHKFLPGSLPANLQSGMCHHMLFQRPVVEDLISLIENYHQMPFWKAFCTCTDLLRLHLPSEYEIYFYFISTRPHELREIKWDNISDPDDIPKYQKSGYHFVSLHSYMRSI